MDDLKEAKRRIGAVADELEEVRTRMLDVHATLPAPPARGPEEDIVGEMEPPSELGAILECLVKDCLDPLIRDLRAVALAPGRQDGGLPSGISGKRRYRPFR